MSSFKNADAGVIVDQLIKTIQKERDYLSEIDGKIGDGDHGINMNKGFTMCEKKLEGTTYNLSEGLTTLGETLLEDIGGSMGPLYGMLFDEMAQACEDEEEITADVFAEMITASVEGIQDISPAPVGPEMAKIPAECNGSAIKSTSTVPSIEVRFFNRIASIFILLPPLLYG